VKLTYTDKQHAYYLDGKRCKSVTALAKIPDDTFRLALWQRRQVAIGLSASPHLIESVAAHHTDNNKLDELCDAAMTAAGSGEAAERGTTAHRVTERVDRGEAIIETPVARSIAEAWSNLLAAAGLEAVPELTERIIVYPSERVCGKFDRILRRLDTGDLIMADLKTGASAIRYPHGPAIQLALYANAPLVADPWLGIDGETTSFNPLPHNLDRDRGLIIHMAADEPAALYVVDIAAGWKCVNEIVFPTVKWRNKKSLIRPMVEQPVPSAEELAQPAAAKPVATAYLASGEPVERGLITALVRRIRTLIEKHPDLAQQVADRWPQGVAPLRAGGQSHADLERVRKLLDTVERQGLALTTPAEGPDVDQETIDRLAERMANLTQPWEADRLNTIARQAEEAGVEIGVRRRPTMRRALITEALLSIVETMVDDVPAVLRDRLLDFEGVPYALLNPALTIGEIAGRLTVEQASTILARVNLNPIEPEAIEKVKAFRAQLTIDGAEEPLPEPPPRKKAPAKRDRTKKAPAKKVPAKRVTKKRKPTKKAVG
jgi:hypothetical protein